MQPTSTPMPTAPNTYLESLQLCNFRCFSDLEIDFDTKLTVLTARNGAGKTSILDAIAIALGTFVGAFANGQGKGALISDVRLHKTQEELGEMAAQYPLVIKVKGTVNGDALEWTRRVNTAKSGTTIKEAKQLTTIAHILREGLASVQAAPVLPLFAYYGTGRLWKQKKLTEKKIFKSEFHSRVSGYQDCLDPASGYKIFLDWFCYAAYAHAEHLNQLREQNQESAHAKPSAYAGLIAAVSEAVDACLQSTGWYGLRYSFVHQTVVMQHNLHGVLEVGQLSDGVRNMVALVADIAYRAVRLNSQWGALAAKQSPGLVMIDEVDMHLHPEWQQQVLSALCFAFPNLQFIVTTHSPQVLSTVNKKNIRVLDTNLDGELVATSPPTQTYGRSNADVMQATMEVDPEPLVPDKQELLDYLDQVEQTPLENAVSLKPVRQQLESVFGADHPRLILADTIMRRRLALELNAAPSNEP